jgi:hypothetical protein
VLSLVAPRAAGAQSATRTAPRLLVRADAVLARANAVQGGLGLTVPLGNYVRLDGVAGAGVEWSGGESRGSGRFDLVGRFLLDPFRQSRWSGYGGAGVSALQAEGEWRGYLLAVVGVEGPGGRGLLPALEFGLGGGTRVGVVLRRAPIDRR